MSLLFLSGGMDGRINHVVFGAVLDEMQVGIGYSQGDVTNQYAAIDLIYPPHLLSGIVKIVKDMQRRGQFPTVSITPSGCVAVLFKARPASRGLVKELFAQTPNGGVYIMLHDEIQVLATAESEFSPDELEPFLSMTRRDGSFNLRLVQNHRFVWGIQLNSFSSSPLIP